MRCGIVGVKLNRSLKLRYGCRILEVQDERVGQGGVRFGQILIEFYCFAGRGQGLARIILWRSGSVVGEDRMSVSESGIGEGVGRILRDRSLKVFDCLL